MVTDDLDVLPRPPMLKDPDPALAAREAIVTAAS
jgi:hypothetical protein